MLARAYLVRDWIWRQLILNMACQHGGKILDTARIVGFFSSLLTWFPSFVVAKRHEEKRVPSITKSTVLEKSSIPFLTGEREGRDEESRERGGGGTLLGIQSAFLSGPARIGGRRSEASHWQLLPKKHPQDFRKTKHELIVHNLTVD